MIHLLDRFTSGPRAKSPSRKPKHSRQRSGSLPSPKASVKSGYESSSSSERDGMAGELDQIGRLTMPSWPSLKDGFSGFASFGNLPQLPSFDLPSFDLSDVSKNISQYMNSLRSKVGDDEDLEKMNSVKTAVATKIQMNSFLQDLRNGRSLQAAIDRLQPLTDLIHEVITLPVDGDEDLDKPEAAFDPEGVGEIVNRDQPLLTQLVPPDGEEIDGLLNPTHRPRRDRHRHKGQKFFKRAGGAILSDDTQTGSDLEYVEELSPEEAKALTHLDSIDDFYKEDLLRSKIQKIQNLADLSQLSKNKLVTRLMMGNYYKYINEQLSEKKGFSLRNQAGLHLPMEKECKHEMEDEPLLTNDEESADESMEDVDDEEVVLTPEDTLPSWFDKDKNILGCSHYQRNCKLECPTCLKWFPCRFCHDQEVTDHKMQRNAVKHILCMKCNAPQVPDSAYCVNCDEELANYFCSQCVLYDNDPNKDIYHCDKCGICRLGLGIGKDYFHCNECNICLSIDLKEHHKCVTNTTHCNCPICNEYLFTSVSKVVFMKCGHLIHQLCYDEMVKHSYKCPVCKKTVVNVETQFRILDQEIRQLPLPHPYNMWRCIISCNDCKGKSSCQYHVLGLKCKYCQSYNTNQLKLIKPEEESAANSAEEDLDGANDRIASMRLMQTNLSSNFIIDEHTTDNNTEYDADYNSDGEELDDQGGNSGSIVNFRRLTKSLLGKRDVDGPSITAVFQKFINNNAVEENSENEVQSETDIIGGF